jgi:hypothetical protein
LDAIVAVIARQEGYVELYLGGGHKLAAEGTIEDFVPIRKRCRSLARSSSPPDSHFRQRRRPEALKGPWASVPTSTGATIRANQKQGSTNNEKPRPLRTMPAMTIGINRNSLSAGIRADVTASMVVLRVKRSVQALFPHARAEGDVRCGI